ncbi:hypothetical protein GCM10025868_42450 [Angustibacter aerolatus]|uniref:Amidohydrolase-related domain-containing protein n=1 Tax=Angustibacter aerolatus TaxID=1162965 RepID=A0ABQ6JL51_9ACTN|nr:hypothetical protein [Angustibacter aerolatus]GMA88995.1 hypothetical protein GCM10025868_42450 [Angustibacter aerolatus]
MSLVIDAHNHVGVRHGASQTGDELVAKMDEAGVDRACVFPFVEGVVDNTAVDDAAGPHPDRLIPYLALNPWTGQAAIDEPAPARRRRCPRPEACTRRSTATT